MTSIGKPSVSRASRRNAAEFLATRSALVPTARTASRGKPRRRSRELGEHLERARLAGAVDALVGGQPGAELRVCSRSVSSG